ncbi:MAG: hypothetical protein MUC95_03100 [Spirochaetes bacterium]|nr:hypothetical protein [Spirochaetota bacterium]
MGLGTVFLSMKTILVIHLIAGPAGFGFLSALYHRKYGYTRPLTAALIFLIFIILMDFFVVGLLIVKDLEMFTNIIGTWAPYTLIFLSA